MISKYYKHVKKRIKKDEFNNVFTSDQIIEDCDFVDFLFLDTFKGKKVVWNATMTTTKGDYYDKVENIAMDEAYVKYPCSHNLLDHFGEPDEHGNCEYINPDPEGTANRMAYMAKRTMEIIASGEISIQAINIDVDETYKYGIGLHIRIDQDMINCGDVTFFVECFTSVGGDTGVTMFDGGPHGNERVTYTAEELGVELNEEGTRVIWSDGRRHNDVAIKSGSPTETALKQIKD